MLSAANLNALEDAGFGFIVGSRITKAPYDLAGHFERHGNYVTDGQVLESARRMGTGQAARSGGWSASASSSASSTTTRPLTP
jgi:hypothetical protein